MSLYVICMSYVCLCFCKLSRYIFLSQLVYTGLLWLKMSLKTSAKLTEANDIFVYFQCTEYQDVDKRRSFGPASALQIKAGTLESVGYNLLVEVYGIMKTSQKWLFHTSRSVHYSLKWHPLNKTFKTLTYRCVF